MDERLWKVADTRLHELRQEDLPDLAKALVAVVRKRGSIALSHNREVSVIVIQTTEAEIAILKEDWERILPFIADGTFLPLVFPAAARAVPLHPETAFRVLELNDRPLYFRILSCLQRTFLEKWPTSDF